MLSAIFLDRDGTIIEDTHYPKDPAQITLIPNAIQGLRLMREKGYLLFVVSNQSGVGRGIISEDAFKKVHEKCCELLQSAGVEIAEFNYCFHHPDDPCHCRKPKTGLVPKSYLDQQIDFAKSYVVGDKDTDLLLADNIGAKGCLVLSGKGNDTFQHLQSIGKEQHYQVVTSLLDFAGQLPSVI